MSRPLVVLRPEPGCGETLAAARALGLAAIGSPLFAIEPVAWSVPEGPFDGILAGSANAFRQGGANLASLSAIPVHAVGERTAEAARAAGFAVASTGEGGLQAVIDRLTPPLRLLRLAGEARVALAPPPGISIAECVVYRAAPRALSGEATAALWSGAVALLHSGEAARAFAAECDRIGLDRGGIAIAALAPRIAEAAGNGWQVVEAAAEVSDAALLALAVQLCQ